ncbi:MAG: YggT family protein [Syntrophobacterales bacterium]|nr:YggT family protein [Syntrophobacterales bacterium]
MFVASRLIEGIALVLQIALNVYFWIVIIRAILSWVNPDPYNPIVRALYGMTDPVLNIIRRRLPVVFGAVDLSPLLLILFIYFLEIFLVGTLLDFARQLR